ncbi:perlustrin-like [Haliotis rubra]|uniref:perlustrin-like n=1 Tax=Haliotis rubra TaxID=36100 RepID=UPI001EE55237|nr:perlustrin-like [Haliotis rubra]
MSRAFFIVVVILGLFYADGLKIAEGPALETTGGRTLETTGGRTLETTDERTLETTSESLEGFTETSMKGPACLPCSQVECKVLDCPLCSHIKDLCGCCDICGRTLGEPCSGLYRCTDDLWCIHVDGDRATARRQLEWHDWYTGVCGALET